MVNKDVYNGVPKNRIGDGRSR